MSHLPYVVLYVIFHPKKGILLFRKQITTLPRGKKVKITPFHYVPRRNFPNPSPPPFLRRKSPVL
jgi:hypothetical protein